MDLTPTTEATTSGPPTEAEAGVPSWPWRPPGEVRDANQVAAGGTQLLGGPIPQSAVDNGAELAAALVEAEVAEAVGQQLTLPGATVTNVGVEIVGPVDPDNVLANLGRLQRSDAWTRWAVGDLFLALVAAHDGDHAPAYVAVAPLGYPANWLNRVIAVAERVPHPNRRAGLSWSHHQAVAVDIVAVDEQSRWLGLAVANGWSVRQLEQAIVDHLMRDQDQLDLDDDDDPVEALPVAKLSREVVATIFEAAALSPSGWVRLHPASGQVLSIAGPV